jgi:hypothetical protein
MKRPQNKLFIIAVVSMFLLNAVVHDCDARNLSAADFKVSPAESYKTVVISGRNYVKEDLVVPHNINLKFDNGGMFQVEQGKTLTINGSFEAPMQQIFKGPGKVLIGPGKVSEVFPQWWGARGDGRHDDTAAIQSAIDSISSGVVTLPPGVYINTGMTVKGDFTLRGSGRGATSLKFTPKKGACLTLPLDCSIFAIEDLSLDADGPNTAFGVDGTNEYVAYFSMRRFRVVGFKTGIYIAAGMSMSFDDGYIGCYGLGERNGTVGLKLGDKVLDKGCTTVTVKDIYFTNAETCFYNRSAPSALIRPIFESCYIGLESRTRAVVISPFFAGIKENGTPVYFEDNGALFFGTYDVHEEFKYAGDTERNSTSWIADTFDMSTASMKIGPIQLEKKGKPSSFFGKKWFSAESAPTEGKWDLGDICWNVSPARGEPVGWVCVKAGTPGTWQGWNTTVKSD